MTHNSSNERANLCPAAQQPRSFFNSNVAQGSKQARINMNKVCQSDPICLKMWCGLMMIDGDWWAWLAWWYPLLGLFGAAAKGQLHLTFSAHCSAHLVDIRQPVSQNMASATSADLLTSYITRPKTSSRIFKRSRHVLTFCQETVPVACCEAPVQILISQ